MKTKNLIIPIVSLLVAATAVAVGVYLYPYNPVEPPVADETGSTQEGIQAVVHANNQFAFDLYSELNKDPKQQGKNIFYSPYSISAALAMTSEGAKGQTADEMQSVFHFPENNILRPNFAAIYNKINENNKDYELRTGNALWAQKDYPFLQDYLDRVERYYAGKAANLDFINQTEESRQTINSFIEEQTNDKIKDLIPKGVLGTLTRLVLTNAIYFKGTWQWEFDKADTQDQDFKITPDNIVKVPMMYMKPNKAEFNYADLEKMQILELPYKGDKISMLILLPKDNLESIENSLTTEKFKEYKNQLEPIKLDEIYLPKFEFDTKYFMKDVLNALGMPTAFSMENADFSAMDGTLMLYISKVIHQAFIKVDEQGTEAAAATAVVMKLESIMPMSSNIFRVDHPFVFLIQEKDTGNILFLGKVLDPTK
ncbi:MAG: serpin family protein [Patescibacteria group bacterium]|nr:serpin family protein [Patescibacteria group bacterium]